MSVRRICFMIGAIALASTVLALMPTTAQNAPPAPTTNTPALPGPLSPQLATNTPQPGFIPPVMSAPDAPYEQYALRLWTETDLVDTLLAQIRQLRPGDTERQLVIRLLQHELQHRFPGAPRNADLRQQATQVMLNAPRGSVDMRLPVRAFIQAALNENKPPFDGIRSLDVHGFNITITPANVDGRSTTQDAVLHTLYPASGEILYEDYTVAQLDELGNYRILDSNPPLPVMPLGNVVAINLERLGDVNNDGADELSLSVDTGSVNRELMIFGWRGGNMVNLVVPGQQLQFGAIMDWPLQADGLTTRVYQVESPEWGCLGQRDVAWKWNLNFFRPPDQLDDFTFQNRLGCLLYSSEPLYEKPIGEAISTIESILQFAQPDDQISVQRANVTLAMLYALEGQDDMAAQQINQLQTQAEPGSWLAHQTAAFLDATSRTGATPVKVCAALETATTYGACNVEQVLTRLFAEQPLRRDEPIEAQLAALGINVLDKETITSVGRRDRQAFRLDLTGNQWWAFAPLQPDVYTAEKIESLPGFQVPPTPLPQLVQPPEGAYDALLLTNNPAAVLNILDNSIRANPGVPLASSARFLQALSYDLLADRSSARQTYFALWSDDPMSIWGQLAAVHLEKR